ncbi:MAG: GTP-binding protein [Fibrobacterota bacterium]|nr:GTP-binding protein [Fibrobacterota bacterium]QQS06851.1 MAG: GTP-binding protein [Fibrobacterota bacterium]
MSSPRIRNIGIIAHVDAGKTTLSEQILLHGGVIRQAGRVDEGMSTMDFLRQEQLRGITIRSGVASFRWADCQINFIDTPGHIDFSLEVERSLRVLDGAIAVFCGVRGVEPRTRAVWALAERFGVPRIGWINKLDMPGADFAGTVLEIEDAFGMAVVPVDWPVVKDGVVVGAVDLVDWTAREIREHQSRKLGSIPPEWLDFAGPARERLLDEASRDDEALMGQIIAGTVDPRVLERAIARACGEHRMLPVTGGAALRGWNTRTVLDSAVRYLPDPKPPKGMESHPGAGLIFQVGQAPQEGRMMVTRVFAGEFKRGDQVRSTSNGDPCEIRSLHRVFADDLQDVEVAGPGEIVAMDLSGGWQIGDTLLALDSELVRFEADHQARLVLEVALEAESDEDHATLRGALSRLAEEDGALLWHEESGTGRCVIRGQGELQLEIALDMLREMTPARFKSSTPHVRRRERLAASAGPQSERGEWPGQWMEIQARVADGSDGVKILWEGDVPPGVKAACEAGIQEAMGHGLAGKAGIESGTWTLKLLGGSDVLPAGLAKKIVDHLSAQLIREAGVVVEVPAVQVSIQTPEEAVGAILAALQTRGIQIQAVDTQRNGAEIRAFSPLEPLLGCATLFRSLSKGQAQLSLEPGGWVAASA